MLFGGIRAKPCWGDKMLKLSFDLLFSDAKQIRSLLVITKTALSTEYFFCLEPSAYLRKELSYR